VGDVLVGNLRDRQMINVERVGAHQMQQQVERALECIEAYGIGRSSHYSPIRERTSAIVVSAVSVARRSPSASALSTTSFRAASSRRRSWIGASSCCTARIMTFLQSTHPIDAVLQPTVSSARSSGVQ